MKKLDKVIKKVKENKELTDLEKETTIKHLQEWYNEKKSIAFLEEKIEEWWDKILPYLDEAGFI